MAKVAVLSDIHGNLPALEAVVSDLEQRGADIVMCLGDHLSGPLWPCESAQFLMGRNWVCIAGNHDRQLVERDISTYGPTDHYADSVLTTNIRDWLRSLPATRTTDQGFFLCHGTPASDMEYLVENIDKERVHLAATQIIANRLQLVDSSVILCGHTHIPQVVQLSEGTLVINPGSVGLPAYTDIHPQPHIVEMGSPAARYAILESASGSRVVELIAVPYDHECAARKAAMNTRPDWEFWLRTGFVS